MRGPPPRWRAPLRRVAELLSESVWAVPAVGVLVGLVAAAALQRVPAPDRLLGVRLATDADTARSVLSTLTTAFATVLSLVFTSLVVGLQLASGVFSPRLVRQVLTDTATKALLTYLTAATTLAVVTLQQVGPGTPTTAGVTAVVVLAVGMVVLVVWFLQHLVELLRVDDLVRRVTERGLRAVERVHPPDHDGGHATDPPPEHAVPVPALGAGYVQAYGLQAIGDAAAAAGVHLRLAQLVGAFLVRDTTVAWCWRDGGAAPAGEDLDLLAREVHHAIAFGAGRVQDHDVPYAFRHLVDIGLRASSPAVNDPTTSVQCVEHMTQLLVRLAQRELCDRHVEVDGHVAVEPQRDLAGYLELAQGQLRDMARGGLALPLALARQLVDVVEAGTAPARVDAARGSLAALREACDGATWSAPARAAIGAAFGSVELALRTGTGQGRPTPTR